MYTTSYSSDEAKEWNYQKYKNTYKYGYDGILHIHGFPKLDSIDYQILFTAEFKWSTNAKLLCGKVVVGVGGQGGGGGFGGSGVVSGSN